MLYLQATKNFMLAFILSITFLLIFLIAFNKISQQIKNLHEELSSQKSKYAKLKGSTRRLKNKLTSSALE